VELESLPLTPNGKLDRKALPAPEGSAYARRGYEPPQGAIEETLASLWSELLGVERISRHDSFFELGGHSLLAVRMIARLRQQLGVELPVQAIFKTRTLALFAALFGQQYEDHQSLVRLAGPEHAPPMFCIHSIGDHIDYYRPLARALSGHFAVYGLYPYAYWWLEERDALQKLAKVHADTIQAQQPEGPYRLLGWSAGGHIAQAVAVELEQRGEQLSYIGLLDTHTVPAEEILVAQNGRGTMPPNLLERSLHDPENVNDADLEIFRPYLQKNDDGQTIQSIRLIYEHQLSMWRQFKRIAESTRTALKVPLHLCWASGSLARDSSMLVDWSHLTDAAAACRNEIIDADHYTMLKEPYVFKLAEVIIKNAALVQIFPMGRIRFLEKD
jgi:thioesterase domain-containing protein/acyl carrier protein